MTAELERRALLSEAGSVQDLDRQLTQSRGIVYWFGHDSIAQLRDDKAASMDRALDHGLLVYFVAENDMAQDALSEILRNGPTQLGLVRRTLPVPTHEIPERMARYDPGPAYNPALEIQRLDDRVDFSGSEETLLRRAFHDCSRIAVSSLSGGRSANVFSVYATFRDSVVGPRPLPFFAKIDKREKIDAERRKYEQYATHFIPFNLRPNLDYRRCICGSSKGLLVGNFVEKSESLWDVARRGQAHAAIYCLFDDTLRGWRLQAFQREGAVVEGPVASALRSVFDPVRAKPEHQRFAERHGVNASPAELWEMLLKLPGQRYRRAPMHGDLHANNVRVRGTDAILIDLLSVTDGPLAADLASLETWLAVERPPEIDRDRDDEPEWRGLMDALYAPRAVAHVPEPQSAASPYAWLWGCIRQIRMMAVPTQVCQTEYQTAIAAHLLRRTMWGGDCQTDTLRRGYAYVTAARLIEALAGGAGR